MVHQSIKYFQVQIRSQLPNKTRDPKALFPSIISQCCIKTGVKASMTWALCRTSWTQKIHRKISARGTISGALYRGDQGV